MRGGACAHEGELVAMKGNIVEFGLKPPYKKSWRIMRGGTCAHEGEFGAMKGRIADFWLKRLENHEWGNLCP